MGKLALVFPGIGYTADKPLLYYSIRLAEQAGYEIRRINYGGFPKKVLGDREKMAKSYEIAWKQTKAQLQELELGDYDSIMFLGKSIGTILAAKIASKSPVKDRIRLILYTPMEDTLRFDFGEAVAFTGSDDPWVGKSESRIAALCAEKGIPCRVIPGGNHSLERGDVLADLQTIQAVMEETARFLEQS